MLKNNNSRILWIDYAKGIGIFLVIVGHFWYFSKYPVVNKLIYSFHMPMFFMLSGFVYNIYKNISIGKYIKEKFIRILLPTIFYLILGVIKLYLTEMQSFKELFRLFIFYDGKCPYNSPCWFFIVLFEIYIIIYIFKYFLRNRYSSLAFSILCLITGYIIYHGKIFIPFGIDRAIIALGFFSVGAFIRHIYNYLKEKDKKTNIILLTMLFIVSTTIWIVFALKNGKVSLYLFSLHTYFYFIITGITGSIVLCIISYLASNIKHFREIATLSNNSIFIICTHYFIVYDLVNLFRDYHILYTKKFALFIPIFTLILLMVYKPICNYLDKHYPFLTGKQKEVI